MVIVEAAGLTDVGRKRKSNQDTLLLDDDLRLYLVADGMGGCQAGDLASSVVVQTIHAYMKRFNGGKDVVESSHLDMTLSIESNQLLSSLQHANREVNQLARSEDSYRGMGSTVSAVYFTGERLIAVNVGDSPIWLVRDRQIDTLSVLHTVVAEYSALTNESSEQLGSCFHHMLTRAMGIDETVRADICELQCFEGDILVIGSDGLSNKVSTEEIHSVVNQERPDAACRMLVDLANERGGDDNITVVVIKVMEIERKRRRVIDAIRRMGMKAIRLSAGKGK